MPLLALFTLQTGPLTSPPTATVSAAPHISRFWLAVFPLYPAVEAEKGIKASGNLSISGGTFVIDSADDALHSNSDISITDGTYEIATGDDGVHADSAVEISGGTMNITQSYEGIEGLTVTITGGEISVVSSDDGMNAAGGTDSSGTGFRGDSFAADADASISISGGIITIDAEGDGIDSNGSLIVGGLIVAFGPTGMAQNFGNSSTQGSIMVSLSGTAGDTVTLTDANGAQLVSCQSKKAFSSVLISCPDLVQGESYTLTSGESSTQITLDSLIYGESGGLGGGFGGGRGGMAPGGTAPDGMTPGETPPDGTMPGEKSGGQRQSA